MNIAPQIDDRNSVRFTGAVYTPQVVANAVVNYAIKAIGQQKKELTVLEPSVGDGAFLRSLSKHNNQITRTICVDIDETVISHLQIDQSHSLLNTAFITNDFIAFANEKLKSPKTKYDLIVGNPPFVRRSNFSSNFKNSITELSESQSRPLQEFKNTWAAFLAAATSLLSNDGVLAFVLPYEILTVSYGQKALSALLQHCARADVFVSEVRAFDNIDQDAVVVIAQKKSSLAHGLFISHVQTLAELRVKKTAQEVHLGNPSSNSVALNSYLFSNSTSVLIKDLQSNTKTIADYAKSAPGVVSAANDFFILPKEAVDRLDLNDFTLPVLKRGSFVSHNPYFSAHDFETLEQKQPCHLLNLDIEPTELPKRLKSYIEAGEEIGLNLRYKCRNRPNWYQVPIVPVAPGFVFKRCHSHPRILQNTAKVYITDTAYGIHPQNGATIEGLTYSFYNSLTFLFAEMYGRFYGGGVLELSPTEFRALPIVYVEPTKQEYKAFLKTHHNAQGDAQKIASFGDNWLQKKMSLSDKQMLTIRNAWIKVRNHRLRHGRPNRTP